MLLLLLLLPDFHWHKNWWWSGHGWISSDSEVPDGRQGLIHQNLRYWTLNSLYKEPTHLRWKAQSAVTAADGRACMEESHQAPPRWSYVWHHNPADVRPPDIGKAMQMQSPCEALWILKLIPESKTA